MSTMFPTPTLSQLLQTVLLVCLLYLLGLVIARGLARLAAHVTTRRSSSHTTCIEDDSTGIDNHPDKKGDVDA